MGRSRQRGIAVTDSPMDAALRVIDVFEALGVPYMIGGSLASAVHGIARSTLDVDLVADLRPEHAVPLKAAHTPASH